MNVNVNFDLTKDLEQQFDNFEKVKNFVTKNKIAAPSTKIGDFEQKYLNHTGKTRMNHRYKEMSREEQAKLYLDQMGILAEDSESEDELEELIEKSTDTDEVDPFS